MNIIMTNLGMEKVVASIRCPALLVHGRDDLVLDGPGTSRQLSNDLGGKVTAWAIDGGDHCARSFRGWPRR